MSKNEFSYHPHWICKSWHLSISGFPEDICPHFPVMKDLSENTQISSSGCVKEPPDETRSTKGDEPVQFEL